MIVKAILICVNSHMLQTARNLWRKNYQGIMAVVFADGKEAVVFLSSCS